MRLKVCARACQDQEPHTPVQLPPLAPRAPVRGSLAQNPGSTPRAWVCQAQGVPQPWTPYIWDTGAASEAAWLVSASKSAEPGQGSSCRAVSAGPLMSLPALLAPMGRVRGAAGLAIALMPARGTACCSLQAARRFKMAPFTAYCTGAALSLLVGLAWVPAADSASREAAFHSNA